MANEDPKAFEVSTSGGMLPSSTTLDALMKAGYVRFPIGGGHQDWYRLPGMDPVSWQDALTQLAVLYAAQQIEIKRLRAAGPKPWYKDLKLLAVAIPVLPTVGIQMSGAVDAYLKYLSPENASLLRLMVGGAATLALGIYTQQHTARGIQQADAVRQIPSTQTQDNQGGRP